MLRKDLRSKSDSDSDFDAQKRVLRMDFYVRFGREGLRAARALARSSGSVATLGPGVVSPKEKVA